MRKIISILVLVVVLCSSLSSCKNEKKVMNTPQNKILFTAKQSGVMNIIKIDLTTKVKKLISTVPFHPLQTYGSGENGIQLSPDKKKFAFQVERKIKDMSLYDIYTMNLDGTSLKQTTKDIKIQNNHNFESLYLKFSFSPDSQFIIISSNLRNKEEDKVFKMKLYVASIDGTNVEEFEEDNPLYHIYFFFLFSENKKLEAIKRNAIDFEYYISYEKSIGIFSWESRKYSPIFKFNETITSCLPSLDQKHIFFTVYIPKSHLEILYDYNIALKSAKKLIESTTNITNMLWLWSTDQILYSKETGEVIEHGIRLERLFLLDIPSLKSELISDSGKILSSSSAHKLPS